jgi:hypothetical protein
MELYVNWIILDDFMATAIERTVVDLPEPATALTTAFSPAFMCFRTVACSSLMGFINILDITIFIYL